LKAYGALSNFDECGKSREFWGKDKFIWGISECKICAYVFLP
jgi:hypothetical protein